MNSQEIKNLERAFDVSLDDTIKRVLRDPGDILKAILETDSYDQDRLIYLDLQTFYGSNIEVRKDTFFFNEDDPDIKWPKEYFILGGDCGGNYYCVNGDEKIYFYNHESFEIVMVHETSLLSR